MRFDAARCSGEFLSLSSAFESAPHSSRSLRTSVDGKLLSVWFLIETVVYIIETVHLFNVLYCKNVKFII